MTHRLLRENCNHCLKNVNIGQPTFECYNCDGIFHARCFSKSQAQVINDKYFCSSCKGKIKVKYNPFKQFESYNTLPDPDDEMTKISKILDTCQSYSVQQLTTEHKENLNKFSSSYFLNVDGNKSNFNSLIAELHRIDHKFTVVGLSETNIGPEESSVYSLNEYNSFYQHTVSSKSKGTGVAIYVHEKLSTVVNVPVSNVTENLESIFVTTRTSCKEATFGVVYRPPSGNFSSFLSELSNILQQLPKKSVQIMGDFNVNLHANTKEVHDFEEVMFGNGFCPLISTYTHEKPGCKQTCIDNIYTNDIDKSIASGTLSDRISHHLPIFHIYDDLSVPNSDSSAKYVQHYNYSESNVQKFVSNLKACFSKSPPQNFDEFHNAFKTNLDKTCKLERPKVSKRTPLNNPWITTGIIASINKKHELHDEWDKARRKYCLRNENTKCNEVDEACHCWPCNSARDKEESFKVKRTQVKKIIHLAKRGYTCNKIDECQGDSKKMWRVINEIRGKRRKQIKPSFLINNERIICRRIIAQEFNNYFVSIASNLNQAYDDNLNSESSRNPASFENYLPPSTASSIYLSDCDSSEISKIISELENGKASDIPAHVMKMSSNVIAEHLAKLYNDCMRSGSFPETLKIGKITPIYKKDDEELLENYRPVSTLPVFGKIFEKIIYSRLYSFLVSKGIIYHNQFGFRKGHSTSHALNFSVNHIEQNLRKKKHVLGIYLDLSKAFDTLPFDKLLSKLSNYGIRGNALKLLSSYLNNRHQYVSVLGEDSEHLPVRLGVPQGSVLGPLLFLVYINDIFRCSKLGTFVLFADDTNIFICAETKEAAFQSANILLESVNKYMQCNLLHINVKKSCYMYFSPSKRQESNVENLHINGIPIKQVTETKFLGVIIDDKLSWLPHIEQLAKKLQSICGRIYRIKSCLPEHLYKQIYHTLFESHLSFGITVWGGVSLNALLPLFRAQKKCIRIMFGDSESFAEKFKTCARSRPIQCKILKNNEITRNSMKPNVKPCSICISLKKKQEKNVIPHRCQHLGGEFYAKESTKPLFKINELMTVHNLYRFRCIMETMKIVKTHVPISMYEIFKMSNRKEDLFITPDPSNNFAYKGSHLWNEFIEQSHLRGKLSTLGSIKSQLRNCIMLAQNEHSDITWYDSNFVSFHSIIDLDSTQPRK